MTTAVARSLDPTPGGGGPTSRSRFPSRETAIVCMIAAGAALVRVPFIGHPLSSDEGGFLLVASQWTPGNSLYGNYWVDRPPLLIAFFELAALLGGTVALRILGILVVMASVLLAGRIGSLVAVPPDLRASRPWAGLAAASTAAIFLVNPRFGATEVTGEMIAASFVLLGVVLLLVAARSDDGPARSARLFAAGAAGAAAVLTKQNEMDVFVVLAASQLTFLRHTHVPARWRELATALAGATSLTALVLVFATTRGTDPAALWTAMITFRFDASAVIWSSASSATGSRLWELLLALAVSGAPLVTAQFLRCLRAPAPAPGLDLRWAALALLGWESVSVLSGGSYWPHYLICLVPGLVLSVAVISASLQRQRWQLTSSAAPILGYSALAAAFSVIPLAVHLDRPSSEGRLTAWLVTHAHPNDTAVVAYGHPNILQATGLSSPYSELWSLPVRVRDPDLNELAGVLAGSGRPDWVVTGAGGLSSWGIDATAGDAQLATHYREVTTVDDYHVYLATVRGATSDRVPHLDDS